MSANEQIAGPVCPECGHLIGHRMSVERDGAIRHLTCVAQYDDYASEALELIEDTAPTPYCYDDPSDEGVRNAA